jgi:hypothetical protein
MVSHVEQSQPDVKPFSTVDQLQFRQRNWEHASGIFRECKERIAHPQAEESSKGE